MWFERLFGFAEEDPEQVRRELWLSDDHITSRVNGRRYRCGQLSMPSLAELRTRGGALPPAAAPSTLCEVVGDVSVLHADSASEGALFQVASQFNLLEMTSPTVVPERGVGIYEFDRTQGPACAIAAGAGTVYRNYFVPLAGGVGQTADRQVDCLQDLGVALGNADGARWQMRNGYALPSASGLRAVCELLTSCSAEELDALRELLRVGWHRDVEVTLPGAGHTVSQIYGSALPIGYSGLPASAWEPFARLVLDASYEATLWAARLGATGSRPRRVYLTLLGGGVFGNPADWIIDAVSRALSRVGGLDVAIVSYGQSNPAVKALCDRHRGA